MEYATMKRSIFGDSAQVMPYVQGRIDKTSGDVIGNDFIMCKVGGEITITFEDGTTQPTTMTDGEIRSISKKWTISITNGTYDFA